MRESLITAFILIVVLVAVNLTSILVNWYLIKADIEDIPERSVKVELLQSFKPIWKVFFKRILYHADSDYFITISDYNRFMTYMNIHNIKYNVHSFHRYDSNLEEFEDIIVRREIETTPSDY